MVAAFNHLLFRCEQEEREISNGRRGHYGLEKTGAFKYAGLASFMQILRGLKVSNNMGHELLDNMRRGNWYIDYALERLADFKPELSQAYTFLATCFDQVKRINSTFRPKYVAMVIEKLYYASLFHLLHIQMKDSKFV